MRPELSQIHHHQAYVPHVEDDTGGAGNAQDASASPRPPHSSPSSYPQAPAGSTWSSVWADFGNLLLLTVLFGVQGLTIGYTGGAISIILIQRGATWNQLGVLSLTAYPWSFKFLTAPLFDTYYSHRIGKRRTYIVPLQVVSAGAYFATAHAMEQWVQDLNVPAIFAFCFVQNVCYACQDIAVQAWGVTLLRDENVGLVSTCQNLGQTAGGFIGFTVYIWLNSPKYLNRVFGTALTEPLVTPLSFQVVIGTLALVSAVHVALCTHERTPPHRTAEWGLSDTLHMMRGFYRNRCLRTVCAYWLASFLTTAPVDNLAYVVLLKDGFSRQLTTTMSLYAIPFGVCATLAAARACRLKREWSHFIVCLCGKFVLNAFLYYTVAAYRHGDNDTLVFWLLAAQACASSVTSTIMFICSLSFNFRMSDVALAGTYLTSLDSVQNFGSAWSGSFVLFLQNYVPFETQFYVSNVLFVAMQVYFAPILVAFEKTTKDDWRLDVDYTHGVGGGGNGGGEEGNNDSREMIVVRRQMHEVA